MKNFVGRKSEFEVLCRIAADAAKGEADSVFLSGRNGTGKSKLLRHVFEYLFSRRNEAVPFLFTFRTSFASVETFAKDYITGFFLQYLAFRKNERSMIDTCVYSLEELRRLAEDSGMKWAVKIMDEYRKILSDKDKVNLFLLAISAPQRSFQETGVPVMVMLDDFNKIKRFCDLNSENCGKDFWMLYEKVIQSPVVPHIFTGLDAEINEMFFDRTVFGESLEVIDLKGLSGEESYEFFYSVCESYGIEIEAGVEELRGIFDGNPFYIKNFLQAARHRGGKVSESEFRRVYAYEVISGKTCKYWTSLLKKYVPQLELRRTALMFLYSLFENAENFFENPEEHLSIGREQLELMLKLLNLSGAVESGFSEVKLAEDMVMRDVIKGLYHREITGKPLDQIEEIILEGKNRLKDPAGLCSFDMVLPDVPNAGSVAVKSLEHIAGQFSIAPEITGQLQLALVELFAGIRNTETIQTHGGCGLRFSRHEDNFLIDITMNKEAPPLSDDYLERLRLFVDEVKNEGEKIILVKDVAGSEALKN